MTNDDCTEAVAEKLHEFFGITGEPAEFYAKELIRIVALYLATEALRENAGKAA